MSVYKKKQFVPIFTSLVNLNMLLCLTEGKMHLHFIYRYFLILFWWEPLEKKYGRFSGRPQSDWERCWKTLQIELFTFANDSRGETKPRLTGILSLESPWTEYILLVTR